MKLSKAKRNNSILLIVIILLIIPQTRQLFQIALNKGLSWVVKPSVVHENERVLLTDYNWQLLDSFGEVYDFNTAKGRVVIVNFWATWCPPCIAEMPSLDALYHKYNEDVVFLFVSSEKQNVTSVFLKKHQYRIPSFYPKTTFPDAFNVTSIPRTFIIDKTGHIVVDKTGAANWNSDMINQQLDTLINE